MMRLFFITHQIYILPHIWGNTERQMLKTSLSSVTITMDWSLQGACLVWSKFGVPASSWEVSNSLKAIFSYFETLLLTWNEEKFTGKLLCVWIISPCLAKMRAVLLVELLVCLLHCCIYWPATIPCTVPVASHLPSSSAILIELSL